jgi:hypothetical protein
VGFCVPAYFQIRSTQDGIPHLVTPDAVGIEEMRMGFEINEDLLRFFIDLTKPPPDTVMS